jgi:hypothetical protein
MNKLNTFVFAALTVLGSVQAMAAGADSVNSVNRTQLVTHLSPSTLTRAEVQAEYQRAVAAGEVHDLSINRYSFPSEQHADSKLTRAEVKAEYQAARVAGAGQVRNISFNNPGVAADSKLTRAEVVAEFVRARDAGELDQANFDDSPHKTGAM